MAQGKRGLQRIGRVVAVVVAAVLLGAPPAAEADLLVRRNAALLSDAERDRFLRAVLALKQAPSPYRTRWRTFDRGIVELPPGAISYYDQFVLWHQRLFECEVGAQLGRPDFTSPGMRAHGGPMFLPWHRHYVRLFERALHEVTGQRIAVPYWEWTSDDQGALERVLHPDFMGGTGDPDRGYAVTEGWFRAPGANPGDPRGEDGWPVTIQPQGAPFHSSWRPHLTRRFGFFGISFDLPTREQIAATLLNQLYDVPNFNTLSPVMGSGTDEPQRGSFRNAIEGYRPTNDGPPFDRLQCLPDGFVFFTGGSEIHHTLHLWTGGLLAGGDPDEPGQVLGTMLQSTSPNDPLFFLAHAYIDRMWASWQRQAADPRYLGPGAEDPGNGRDDQMFPFDQDHRRGRPVKATTPRMVEETEDLGYVYDSYASPASAASAATAAAEASAAAAQDLRFRQLCRMLLARAAASRGS